jgi:hypothetical protein
VLLAAGRPGFHVLALSLERYGIAHPRFGLVAPVRRPQWNFRVETVSAAPASTSSQHLPGSGTKLGQRPARGQRGPSPKRASAAASLKHTM